MKRKLLLIGLAFMSLSSMYAQNRVGLGNSTLPNESSILDMGATNLGVLVPRVSLKDEDDKTTIAGTNYPESLLVYNTGEGTSNLKKGFYFWLDGKWNALVAKTTLQTDETLTSREFDLSY
ncbi:hypothetical protein NWE55_04260 [Myroides albus]|uniref:hypothetical protein n=1 Tax=Myroides albus TaxID=2562892 RepID=UPI00215947AF|nr:hypothetical protein [Myroides albus]UVD80491.1 hypothetical protein NWE55_04260 [Myroides albus]